MYDLYVYFWGCFEFRISETVAKSLLSENWDISSRLKFPKSTKLRLWRVAPLFFGEGGDWYSVHPPLVLTGVLAPVSAAAAGAGGGVVVVALLHPPDVPVLGAFHVPFSRALQTHRKHTIKTQFPSFHRHPKAMFTGNVCICLFVKCQGRVLWQQVILFTLSFQ